MIERLLPFLLTLLMRSLRFKWIGTSLPDSGVVAFWHSRMLAGWWVSRDNSVALVSKSKDGQYLDSILKRWSYQRVRGSSSTSGKEALNEAIAIVRTGGALKIVITPDGPQGPPEVFKRGVFIAAHELSLPIYFLSINYRTAITLHKSWDHFQIPLPFSKVIIRAAEIDATGFPSDGEEQRNFLGYASQEFKTKEPG
ncbi:MAG: DUF374 domain-containing protein [Ignavibacteriota bacterium]